MEKQIECIRAAITREYIVASTALNMVIAGY
jgi:hypothetical protein